MSESGLLTGRVVLLVGGSTGIGADAARVLAADVARFVDATFTRFGRLDGAFHNAGVNPGGVIVNTSSIGGFRDNGPPGIRVNAHCPRTDRRCSRGGGRRTRRRWPRRVAAVPMRKAGTTTEVANAAAWLLSDRAGHVSGVVLPDDGTYGA